MIWLIMFAVVAGIILLRWYLVKPRYYGGISRAAFPRFIRGMLAQGGHGHLLFFEHEGSERFVQFAKYFESRAERNLHFGFPLAAWSDAYYAPLKERLSAEGFSCAEREAGGEAFGRFLCVDYIGSAEEAARLASIAFDVMGVGAGETFAAHYEGPLSLDEWRRHVKMRRGKRRE